MGRSKYIQVALYRNNRIPKPEQPEVCFLHLNPENPYAKARIYSFSLTDSDTIN